MKAFDLATQPVRDDDGNIFAWVMPASEYDRLREEAESLRAELARMREQMEVQPIIVESPPVDR